MGLYKMTSEAASVIYGCGHDVDIEIATLKVLPWGVRFPMCPECGRATLVVKCVTVDGPESDDSRSRNRIIHTLHKRLVDAGQFEDGVTADDVADGVNALAVDDDNVEAPVHPAYRAKRIPRG